MTPWGKEMGVYPIQTGSDLSKSEVIWSFGPRHPVQSTIFGQKVGYLGISSFRGDNRVWTAMDTV